jgi:nitrite reductase (NADH) small subunit
VTTLVDTTWARNRSQRSVRLWPTPSAVVPDAWIDVCEASAIRVETGVCVLVGKDQIAIFRLHNGTLLAIGNVDPISGAAVLSRGIVGDSQGVPKVSSPLYKQAFDLRTGICLVDPSLRVPNYAVRQVEDTVQVQACMAAVFLSSQPADGLDRG